MGMGNFKGSLLATTIIAGAALACPAYAQEPVPAQNPTNVQGTAPPAPASDQTPAEGVQTSESAAPAEPTSAEEIVVTGTLIRNPNLVASAPVTVVGQEEMQLRQTNVAEEVLRTIPAAVPSIGSNVNNGQGGSSFVNLRGLGSRRNIVLLDGVRIVPVDLVSRVDLNNIPLALVDRVDVLTGGASSTYGADAVTGVVNFITRSDFSGVEVSVGDQITQRGDGNYLRGDLTVGANFDDGRGNAVLSIGYQESDPVFQGGNEREFSQISLESLDAVNLVFAGSTTTTPSRTNFGGGNDFQVDPTGTTLIPFYQSFNFAPYNVFQTPFKRYNIYGAGHYDISDHVTAYARGLFSNNTIDSIIAPSGVFNQAVTVNASNPFITPAQLQVMCALADTDPATPGRQVLGAGSAACTAAAAATSPTDPNFRSFTFNLGRRTLEVGPRISDFNTNVFDMRAGIRGDITDKIGWDLWGSRGESKKVQTIQNYVLVSRARQSLQAINTSAGPVCINPAGGCVPVNFFGPTGAITPEMADFLSDSATVTTRVRLAQARGTINGDAPFAMPWSEQPLGFAVGAEYRKYTAQQLSDVLAKTPGELGGSGGAAPDINGAFDVYEGFAELIAPIITDRPFFDELQIEGGIRRSHYTIDATGQPKFNTTTWKVAGSWSPVRDIKFRGNYNRAVRAPNISELFTPVTTVLTNLASDPCAGAAPLTNPNLAAICLAQGADPTALGTIQNPTAGQANITIGGNPFLGPETANTWTIGAVLRPRFLAGFDATLDYYNIKIKAAISAPTPGDIIAACFANITAASATSPACLGIRRNPLDASLSGDPATTFGLPAALSNLGRAATDGVDLTMNYRRNLGDLLGAPAKINLNFAGNYTRHAKFQATPTDVNRDCTGFYSINCDPPTPKYTFNQRTTLSLGRVDLSLLWRYIHKVKYEPLQLATEVEAAEANPDGCTPFSLPHPDPVGPGGIDPGGCIMDPEFRKIKTYHYFDLTSRFNVNEHFDLTFTVQNLFDKKPPNIGNTIATTTFNSGNTEPSTYDAIGRRFAAGARVKF